MEELIVSKEKLEQNRKNQLLKDESRKEKRKQELLNTLCINIVIWLILILVVIWGIVIAGELQREGIRGCMENGYTYDYCVEHS